MNRTGAPPNILLVEDSEADGHLLVHFIREVGFEGSLEWARDGEAAINHLMSRQQPTPHLVILDLGLPKLNGYEVLKRIRSTPVLAGLSVIVLSTSRMADDIFRCQELGISKFHTKPCELADVKALAQQLVTFSIDCQADRGGFTGSPAAASLCNLPDVKDESDGPE